MSLFSTCKQVHNSEENLHVVGLVQNFTQALPLGIRTLYLPQGYKKHHDSPPTPVLFYQLTMEAGAQEPLGHKNHSLKKPKI